jgi:hypothetical protein
MEKDLSFAARHLAFLSSALNNALGPEELNFLSE